MVKRYTGPVHLVATPGDRRVACGLLSVDLATCWVRWMGAHEVGHLFAGRQPPSWCFDCCAKCHDSRGR
jgi:hypothetical protein